jgi:PAS domain S-box-containing protein
VDKLAVVFDEHRMYRFVSESFAQALGYRPEELIGKRIDDITVEKSVDLDFVFKAFLELGEMDGLWLCKHRNGSYLLIHYHARLTLDGLYAEAEPLSIAA